MLEDLPPLAGLEKRPEATHPTPDAGVSRRGGSWARHGLQQAPTGYVALGMAAAAGFQAPDTLSGHDTGAVMLRSQLKRPPGPSKRYNSPEMRVRLTVRCGACAGLRGLLNSSERLGNRYQKVER